MTLYLIAHKVRGERAFDVAQKMEMADGTWWIIPTSGHRAHPYWWWELGYAFNEDSVPEPPEGLQDHYSIEERINQRLKKLAAELTDHPKLEDL